MEIELEIHDASGQTHRMTTTVASEPALGTLLNIVVDGTDAQYVVTRVYRRATPEPTIVAVLHLPREPGTLPIGGW